MDNEPKTSELLACPFCGGAADLWGGWADGHYIACDDCECALGRDWSEGEPANNFSSEAEAIAAWNRRTVTPPAPADHAPTAPGPNDGGTPQP